MSSFKLSRLIMTFGMTFLFAVIGCSSEEISSTSNSGTEPLTGRVEVDGSSTVAPVSEAVAEEFKIQFPEKEIKEFADSVVPDVDQYFVGHFHIDKLIKVDGCKSVLRVVPDWLSQRTVVRVSEHGEIEVLRYQNGSLVNLY